MKRIFLIALSSCFSMLYAQKVTVSSTEEYTNEIQNAQWTKVLGEDETGYYLLREFGPVNNATIALEKYSPALKLLFTTNIQSTSGTFFDSQLHRYTEMKNGKIYIFLEGWNKDKQENSFLIKEVLEDGTVAESFITLETEYSKSQMKSAHYTFSFSPDGSKLLVLTQKPFTKKASEEVRLQVFNTADFSSIWQQDLTLENEAERYPVNDIILDNNGIAYLLKDIKISNKEHIYNLITAGKDFSEVTNIELNEYALGDKKMFINPKGNLLMSGMLFPLGGRATDWQGTWFFQSDKTGKIIQNKVEPLGAEMLSRVVSENNANKEGYALDNYLFKDVLMKPDGGVILLTEEKRISKTAIGQNQPPTYQYEIFHGNAFAISFDQNGNRLWNQVIEKKQEEKTLDPDIGFGSFAYHLKEDKLFIVWNYMDIFLEAPLQRFRFWIDRDRNKTNIDNLFGKEALYPTLLTVINSNGQHEYAERSFNSLPLYSIQKPNAFPMAVNPSMFFTSPNGMIIISQMQGIQAKRYKFNTIEY
ncbi:hypothetical protein ERX46_01260 [Brumimicrobium glaciale]|uniref:S9 family peptidase n=1 Tax=Brumimicrobium glaciale TaxID=200475 RepID=A0A4Q4KQ12_9FLAO|nr:hypothetical protein [Brumimicrobium glaciale]RYM35648.1 hypothetical protein ERX46_01260 [Brumimicrobium glaciale]